MDEMKIYSNFILEYEGKIEHVELWSKIKTEISSAEYDYDNFYILDLKSMVKKFENMGIELKEELLDGKGRVSYDENTGKFEITIDFTDPIQIQRFTIAHELGHILLHKTKLIEKGNMNSDYYEDEVNHDVTEIEANKFAAELLVPKDDISRYTNDTLSEYKKEEKKLFVDDYLKKCSKRYNVSVTMLENRMKNLGIIK